MGGGPVTTQWAQDPASWWTKFKDCASIVGFDDIKSGGVVGTELVVVKMKRDHDGNAVPDSFDSHDFQAKMRALVDFTNKSCSFEKYGDHFLIFITDDETHKEKRNIQFYWFCKRFRSDKEVQVDDARDHEGVLGMHFQDFDVLISKYKVNWRVDISTSANKPGSQKILLRATPKDV